MPVWSTCYVSVVCGLCATFVDCGQTVIGRPVFFPQADRSSIWRLMRKVASKSVGVIFELNGPGSWSLVWGLTCPRSHGWPTWPIHNGAFRPYSTPTRNPIWRPENRKWFEICVNTIYLCLYYSYKLNFNGYPHIFDYARLRRASADIGRHPEPKMALTKTGSGNNSSCFHFRFLGRHFDFPVSADVGLCLAGSVISESGMVENVGVAAGAASPVLSVQELFRLPGYRPPFWAPVVAHFAFGVGLLSWGVRLVSSDDNCAALHKSSHISTSSE